MTQENQNALDLSSIDLSVLAGMLPQGGVPAAAKGFDFQQIIQVAQILSKPDANHDGKVDAKDVLAIAMQNPHLIGLLFGAIGGLFKRKPKAGPVVVQPITLPTPEQIAAAKEAQAKEQWSQGGNATAAQPPVSTPVLTRLDLSPFFIEEWEGGRQGSGRVVDRARFEEVTQGRGAVGRGAKIHYNCNPMAATGEIRPGDPRHDTMNGGAPYLDVQLSIDGEPGEWCPAGEQASWGPFELHQNDKNYGCTFFIKVPADYSGGRQAIQVRVRYTKGGQPVSQWTEPIYAAGH